MGKRISVDEYFTFPETRRPMELVYGCVREPAMPSFGHEAILLQIAAVLRDHVREHNLGQVCRADVVLDREAGLVVQPDLFFISTERMGIVDDRVWGAPDLVIEIASPSTERRDRTVKLGWFRRYGVRECWLVQPRGETIEIVNFDSGSRQRFSGQDQLVSGVLPKLAATAAGCFR